MVRRGKGAVAAGVREQALSRRYEHLQAAQRAECISQGLS